MGRKEGESGRKEREQMRGERRFSQRAYKVINFRKLITCKSAIFHEVMAQL